MKKIVSMILAVAMIISVFAVSAMAADVTVSVSSESDVEAGETVYLTVSLVNNPGFNACDFKIVADEGLTITNVATNGLTAGPVENPGASYGNFDNAYTSDELCVVTVAVSDSVVAGQTYNVYVEDATFAIFEEAANEGEGEEIELEVGYSDGGVTIAGEPAGGGEVTPPPANPVCSCVGVRDTKCTESSKKEDCAVCATNPGQCAVVSGGGNNGEGGDEVGGEDTPPADTSEPSPEDEARDELLAVVEEAVAKEIAEALEEHHDGHEENPIDLDEYAIEHVSRFITDALSGNDVFITFTYEGVTYVIDGSKLPMSPPWRVYYTFEQLVRLFATVA